MKGTTLICVILTIDRSWNHLVHLSFSLLLGSEKLRFLRNSVATYLTVHADILQKIIDYFIAVDSSKAVVLWLDYVCKQQTEEM